MKKQNLTYNLEKYGDNENILFITGLSGSGKTTLSYKLSYEYNAEVLELDCMGNYYNDKYNNTVIHNITSKFLNENQDINYIIKNKKYMELKLYNFDKYIMINDRYFKYIVNYCNNSKGLYIVEGTQLFMTINPEYFIEKPVIIVGTSAMKSFYRRLKRQLTKEEKQHPFTKGRRHIKKLLNDSKRLHYKDVKKLKKFIELLNANI